MNRRQFVAYTTLSAATILSRGSPVLAKNVGRHVVVAGAGIIGASIAYHLAALGVQVTVLERRQPAAGATHGSFAWINAFGKTPRPHYDLNLLGILAWHRLQQEIGATLAVQWGGGVQWQAGASATDRALATIRKQSQMGYPIRQVGAKQLRALLPGLTLDGASTGVFGLAEGTVNPVMATQAIIAAAKRLGVSFRFPVTVTGFEVTAGRVRGVKTDNGTVSVDDVVIAAGLGTSDLAAMLGAKIPLSAVPGLLAHSEPMPRLLERVVIAPNATLKQNPDGSMVTGINLGTTLDTPPNRENGIKLLSQAAALLPSLRSAKLAEVTLGERVFPRDAHPIVGRLAACANVYVAAMHSGITMGPLIGQLAATEILDDVQVDLLAPFRPERFA